MHARIPRIPKRSKRKISWRGSYRGKRALGPHTGNIIGKRKNIRKKVEKEESSKENL